MHPIPLVGILPVFRFFLDCALQGIFEELEKQHEGYNDEEYWNGHVEKCRPAWVVLGNMHLISPSVLPFQGMCRSRLRIITFIPYKF